VLVAHRFRVIREPMLAGNIVEQRERRQSGKGLRSSAARAAAFGRSVEHAGLLLPDLGQDFVLID